MADVIDTVKDTVDNVASTAKDVARNIVTSPWMNESQMRQQYDPISPDGGPINVMFTEDSTITLMGNNYSERVDVKKGDQFYIIGRDNSAVTNTKDEFIIQDSQGRYASIHIDTNFNKMNPDTDKTYTSAGELARSQINGLGFVGNEKAYNKLVFDSDATIKNLKDQILNKEKQKIDLDFSNANTKYGEKIVVPDDRDVNVSAIQNRMEPTIWAYGLPPQWTKYVDPRVMGFTTCYASEGPQINVGLGRRYTAVTVSNPTILEIAPGFMKYSKWMDRDETFLDNLDDFKDGASESSVKALIASFDEHSGRFYKIMPCFMDQKYSMTDTSDKRFKFGGYISYVSYLMTIAAVFLSREEIQRTSGSTVVNTDTTFKKFTSNGASEDLPPLVDRIVPIPNSDYGKYRGINWQLYNKHSGYLTIGGTVGVVGGVGGASNTDTSSNAHGTAFDYMKFYLSGSTSATDSFSTNVEESMLGQLANTLNMAMKESAYWLDSLGGKLVSDLTTAASEIIDAVDLDGQKPLGGVFNVQEMLGGGKIVFPQIITDSKYGKSIECECTFASIYGDEEALFVNTIMPYMHLLAFVLPHQVRTSLEMYTFPFIVKAFCRGLFNVEMGAITSFSVQRGGSDNALWSFNGTAEIVTVNFEITPLINNLVMTSTQDGPGWLLKNNGLHEYMSAVTGFDARNDHFELAMDIWAAGLQQSIIAKKSNILTPLLQNEFINEGVQFVRRLNEVNASPMDLLGMVSQNVAEGVTNRFANPVVPANTNINDYDMTGQSQGLIGNKNLGGI